MLGLEVTVPIACFRKGFAREFWETEDLPPPSTCYGFLLSLVGERDRRRHVGARVCPALLEAPGARPHGPPKPQRSMVLRTLWRIKQTSLPQGAGSNARPDYQELLTHLELAVWLDSSAETDRDGPTLEDRVALALDRPERIDRFGGLSLGESTHLVDRVGRLRPQDERAAWAYLAAERGRLSLPVWVDHVGSAKTRFVTGDLEMVPSGAVPPLDRMPRIDPS